MYRISRPATCLTLTFVVAACAGGSQGSPAASSVEASPPPASSPVPTTGLASPSPSTAPTQAASPAAFTSNLYGYSLTVPNGWTSVQAALRWDGTGAPSHDVAEVDQFISTAAQSAWFYGAPTTKDLPAWVDDTIAGVYADHSDTCPPVPAFQDPIEVGAEPGVLIGFDCGILINLAVAVHDGTGYTFGFRDPGIHAATYPSDRETFLGLLESVQFPT